MISHLLRTIALSFLCIPAFGTTVALIWTPKEIVVAADSAEFGQSDSRFCKIRQAGAIFLAIEGMIDINAPVPSSSFHAVALAQKAATVSGTISDKALKFENLAKPAFQHAIEENKKTAPTDYKNYHSLLVHPQALQVVFFGLGPEKSPVYALLTFDVKENAVGDPIVTVEKTFCPGQGCFSGGDLRILGESAKAHELSQRAGFPGPDLAVAVRDLVEAEAQDRPKLVRPPIDVLRISALGALWMSEKRECKAVNH